MRSSRRTELEEHFPNHASNEWLGHSQKIAEKHYLQVTSTHWESAVGFSIGGNAGGNSSANLDASTEITNKKTPAKAGVDGCGLPVMAIPMTPTVLENKSETLEKRLGSNFAGPPAGLPSTNAIDSVAFSAEEIGLIQSFRVLDKTLRLKLLKIAAQLESSC